MLHVSFSLCAVLRAGGVGVEEDETFPDPAEVAGLNVSSDTSASITLPSRLLASRSQGELHIHLYATITLKALECFEAYCHPL